METQAKLCLYEEQVVWTMSAARTLDSYIGEKKKSEPYFILIPRILT